jgi:hypothetical protein
LLLQSTDYIVSFSGYTSDRFNIPIDFPPLHIHHLHVIKDGTTHWWETHGDYGDTNITDSTRGYTTRIPTPYCITVDSTNNIRLEAIINDVRNQYNIGMGSSYKYRELYEKHTIEWYLLFSFTTTVSYCTPVHKLILFYPFTPKIQTDFYQRYTVPNKPAISWWGSKMPFSGTLLPNVRIHAHRARLGGFLVFSYSLKELEYYMKGNSMLRNVRYHDMEDYAFISNFSDAYNYLRSSRNVVCELSPDISDSIKRETLFYDRQGSVICSNWSINKGDPYTIVVFHLPKWDIHKTLFMQHSILFLYINPETGIKKSSATQFTSTHSELNS